MPKKSKADVSVSVDHSLKAAAIYERKKVHTITEHVPEDVTREKASAWLDMIAPAREWLGLKGDILRGKREELALQRHQTLSEIARRFIANRPVDAPVEMLPPKFLVQFIEQASLEEPDSELVTLWANLLCSAAEKYDPTFIHFTRVISTMSPSQARVFHDMFRAETLHQLELGLDDVDMHFEAALFRSSFASQLEGSQAADDEGFAQVITRYFGCSAVQVQHVAFQGKEYYDVVFPYDTAQDAQNIDLAILEALGLIRRVSTAFEDYNLDYKSWSMAATYYHITHLGFELFKACKMRPLSMKIQARTRKPKSPKEDKA